MSENVSPRFYDSDLSTTYVSKCFKLVHIFNINNYGCGSQVMHSEEGNHILKGKGTSLHIMIWLMDYVFA